MGPSLPTWTTKSILGLLGALSASERRELADLLRKLLASEPFAALDPRRPEDKPGRAGGQAVRGRPRRR
jgi:hypothetical protein